MFSPTGAVVKKASLSKSSLYLHFDHACHKFVCSPVFTDALEKTLNMNNREEEGKRRLIAMARASVETPIAVWLLNISIYGFR